MTPFLTRMRTPSAVFGLVVAAIWLSFCAIFLAADVRWLLAMTADGSGYYLQIARNAASGQGLTFDGIHPTNGFHPLWVAFLVALFKTVTGSSEQLFRVAGVLAVTLFSLASWLFHATLRRVLSSPAALFGGLVYVALAFSMLTLMESALLLTTSSVLFWYGVTRGVYASSGVRPPLIFGVLLGLVILSRLDSAFLSLAIGTAGLIQIALEPREWRVPFRRTATIAAGAALLVVPYLIFNHRVFGSILPVSGRIESTFPRPHLELLPALVAQLGKQRQLVLLLAAGYLVWFAWKRPFRAESRERRLASAGTAMLCAGGLMHALNELLFMRWQLYWHFALLVPVAGAVLAFAFDEFETRTATSRVRLATYAGSLALLAFFGLAGAKRMFTDTGNAWQSVAYESAIWLRENTDQSAVVAMPRSEVTGYFSDRQVIDLAGLCNTFDLQQVIHDGQLAKYLAENGASYFVQVGDLGMLKAAGGDVLSGNYDRAMLQVRSELHGSLSDPIVVRRSNEVYRSRAYNERGSPQLALIWHF